MAPSDTCDIDIILIQDEIDHTWHEFTQGFSWRLFSIVPGGEGRVFVQQEDRAPKKGRYRSCSTVLELFPKETAAYKVNLENREPVIYVVLREDEEADEPVEVHLATVSPYEAQDYMDSGEENVDSCPMPDEIRYWVQAFVGENHKEEKFKKRKRDEVDLEEHKFGQEPIFVLRERMKRKPNGKS